MYCFNFIFFYSRKCIIRLKVFGDLGKLGFFIGEVNGVINLFG